MTDDRKCSDTLTHVGGLADDAGKGRIEGRLSGVLGKFEEQHLFFPRATSKQFCDARQVFGERGCKFKSIRTT